MLDGAMLVWFILTGMSLVFVIGDSVINGVTSWVQRAAWILVTVYAGPVGAFFYLLACRRPFPGGHDQFTAATWKQGLNSEMHCLAGDATGIIVAACIVPALAVSNGWDITIEYLAGFGFGLFIFQALMMVGMYDGNYFKAVRKTVFAETVSMNFVMAGMIPTMLLLGSAWEGSGDPFHPAFWFRMSLASIVGGVLAFPINYWLVKNRLKHGCMTLPGADAPAHGVGHRSPEPMNMKGMDDTEDMEDMMGGDPGMHSDHHDMAMKSLSLGESAAWVIGSFVVLLVLLWLTHLFVPIRFTASG